MKITYRDVEDIGELVHVYNEQTASVPHCYPISREEFEIGLLDPRNDRHCKEAHSERIIAAEEDGRITGFAHIAIGRVEFSDRKQVGGLLHFLTYESGHRAAGQALLEACEKHTFDSGASQVWAFQNGCNYRFYHLDFGNVSDHMGHVYALFHMNGYKVNEGEIFMEQPDYSIIEPVLPDHQVEIVVEQKPGRGVLPGLLVQAFRDGEEVGSCESGSCGDCCKTGEVQDWFFVHWLGVDRHDQGKGWGRYLLQRTLWEMRKIGYKNAIISTDITNPRALLFYTNYGYRVSDTVYGLVKHL
ncbi:GNAT family N-acetyltransferase [Candidatus Poribacteria bacterium]